MIKTTGKLEVFTADDDLIIGRPPNVLGIYQLIASPEIPPSNCSVACWISKNKEAVGYVSSSKETFAYIDDGDPDGCSAEVHFKKYVSPEEAIRQVALRIFGDD